MFINSQQIKIHLKRPQYALNVFHRVLKMSLKALEVKRTSLFHNTCELNVTVCSFYGLSKLLFSLSEAN